MKLIDGYRRETEQLSGPELLGWALATFGPHGVAFASSMGAEDQVITHMLADSAPHLRIFTLDTGRLYQETYELIEKTRARYTLDISLYFPDAGRVEEMVRTRGPNLFYESVENRKLCCRVRKVEPLGRALHGLSAWIVGLRRDQAVTRNDLNRIEWDEANGLVKSAPLAGWSESEVWEFIRKNEVPCHELHEQGFPSIGCAPCTRAIKPGEDTRAGRWWWEQPEHKECGLHSAGEATASSPVPAPFGIGTLRND